VKKLRNTLTVAVLAAALSISAAPLASAASVEDSSSDAEVFEFTVPRPNLTGSNEGAPRSTASTTAVAAICEFTQRVDYVHISSTSTRRAVQSHGNWDNENCNYALADVTTQIDKRNVLGFYYAVGTQGKGRLAPNPRGLTSGPPGRVTAHYDCNGTAANMWRSWTDIDIVGYNDAPNRVYSPPIERACG